MTFCLQEAGPLEEMGMVMAVLDKSFDVYVLNLGVVKRVYCDVSRGVRLLGGGGLGGWGWGLCYEVWKQGGRDYPDSSSLSVLILYLEA